MRRLLPAIALLTAACAPQSATITDGHHWTFLSASTFDSPFGDVEGQEGVDAYSVDCRDREEGEARLPESLDICSETAWPPRHEGWMDFDGHYVISEDLVPWRGEAIITSEGDLQLGFHQRVLDGEDFRFAFVVDPNFQPTRCVEAESGGVTLEDIDGDWVGSWSEDVESGTLYYLNSGSRQFNPSNTEDVWVLPQEWRAGYTAGKYAGSDFLSRTTRYGEPAAYARFEADDVDLPGADELFYTSCPVGEDITSCSSFTSLVEDVNEIADEIEAELALVGVTFRPRVHTNSWRPVDEQSAGLDGWVGLHYNWVRFDSGSTIEIGGSVSGDFALTLDAGTSGRQFITGSFEVEKIKRDRWVTDDIEAIKLEENETTICGQ